MAAERLGARLRCPRTGSDGRFLSEKRSPPADGTEADWTSRRRAPAPTLSAQLRDETREEHFAVEAAFALESRLGSYGAYGGLLLALRGFYRPVEAALSSVAGWNELNPTVDIASRRRADLLDEDLDGLRIEIPVGRAGPPSPGLVVDSVAKGLGCIYVLEGSALGGQVVARRARASLGEGVPVAFFSSAGRENLRGDWRLLQGALDGFGACHGPASSVEVVASARRTFAALGAWLGSQSPDRGDCRLAPRHVSPRLVR
jgi:heme oxygenase